MQYQESSLQEVMENASFWHELSNYYCLHKWLVTSQRPTLVAWYQET